MLTCKDAHVRSVSVSKSGSALTLCEFTRCASCCPHAAIIAASRASGTERMNGGCAYLRLEDFFHCIPFRAVVLLPYRPGKQCHANACVSVADDRSVTPENKTFLSRHYPLYTPLPSEAKRQLHAPTMRATVAASWRTSCQRVSRRCCWQSRLESVPHSAGGRRASLTQGRPPRTMRPLSTCAEKGLAAAGRRRCSSRPRSRDMM